MLTNNYSNEWTTERKKCKDTTGLEFLEFQESLIRTRLMNLALNCFKWEGLPPSIEPRFIEMGLYENGEVFFYNNKKLGLICLPCTVGSHLDIYAQPVNVNITGLNFYDIQLVRDGVRILNNDTGTPTRFFINDYSKKMSMVEKTIQTNIYQQKFPIIAKTTDKELMSAKSVLGKANDGEIAIFLDKSKMNTSDEKPFEVFDMKVPVIFNDLYEYRNNLESEILSFLGINNTDTKKERMLVDEVNSNNTFIERNLDVMLWQREKACKLINEKFGLNVTVEKVNQIYANEQLEMEGEINVE